MNYQKITGESVERVQDDRETIYPKFKDLAAGTVIAEGLYTGSYESPNRFDASKTNITYFFDCGDVKVGLNKAGNLGYLINKANLTSNESQVRITYLGMDKIAKGPLAGRPAHSFQLEVADKA